MTGILIRETVVEGIMDWAHGGGHSIVRLIVPDSNNLAFTVEGAALYVFDGFDMNPEQRRDLEILRRDVPVPDELVRLARAELAGRGTIRELLVPILDSAPK